MSPAEQLTLDGGVVPHDEVVRGPSSSRMVRRPAASGNPAGARFDDHEWLSKLVNALDNAGVRPGEAFYVSRVPPVDRRHDGGARTSDPSTSKRAAKLVAPRTGTQRWSLLSEFSRVFHNDVERDGWTAEEASEAIGVPGAWRRVSELLQGGYIEPTGAERKTRSGTDAGVYRITDKGREVLAAGRTTA